MATKTMLPGEAEQLPMRYGGEPITPDEALGVSRRIARVQIAQGRTKVKVLDELPPADAPLVPWACRLPPRLLAFVRAKADMEGVTVTDVVTQALTAYANSTPGATVHYKAPRRSS
ncbi:MAG TPA: hypothetical protein VKY71_00155 [Actinotalea caeni]|uniref:hypothetical protein n=1 Tax=Actinotalea caeni TaxID=1348467 RepID=UPI002B4AB683|nr:hypothetical protein [Actinotalea caeni]HLV53964.1 hypothetical protein [Actinotalea caeni]